MKLQKTYAILLVIALFECCMQSQPDGETLKKINSSACTNNILIKKLIDNSSDFSIELNFPQICKSELSEIDKKINDEIFSNSKSEITDFKANERIQCQAQMEFKEQNSAFHAYCDVPFNSDKYLSMRLFIYIDWSGDPIPNKFVKTLNFERKTGKLLKIKDFVTLSKDQEKLWVKAMQKECQKRFFNSQLKDCNHVWEEEMTMENFSNFTLTDKGIDFIFDYYQQNTTHCGVREQFFSFDELANLLKALP